MDSKRVTRARKMNTAEQENETMSAPTSRSSETGTSSTHTWDHGTNENLSGSSPGQERIDEEKSEHGATEEARRVIGSIKFEQLESERIAARRGRAYKMLLLRLEADEEDSGDLIDCDNASHLSKTDKLEKRTVTLATLSPCPNRVRRQRHHCHRRHAAKSIVHPS
ncbi:hypothetical protein EVAR_91730_1 [Eumeta japonica]|uniref:Uncharacterized protein n=1 Tax=Eumeta variegata TaxID=151549 RepID=A0A4C1T163_EUMVA|nr:hypothetical protein EVAR_91730_1 [Eumeta japonica]